MASQQPQTTSNSKKLLDFAKNVSFVISTATALITWFRVQKNFDLFTSVLIYGAPFAALAVLLYGLMRAKKLIGQDRVDFERKIVFAIVGIMVIQLGWLVFYAVR